jgi:hypothetical protein
MVVDMGTVGICEKAVNARENQTHIFRKPSVFFRSRRFSKSLFLWKNLQF